MNLIEFTHRLKAKCVGVPYKGLLSNYIVQSIESGRRNYSVSNLLKYCEDRKFKIRMKDEVTEDCFYPVTTLEVHQTLDLLMKRYKIDTKFIYRETALYYTQPKTFDPEELKQIRLKKPSQSVAPLSIKTLLSVCEVIHCDLALE